jgi:hypothetical protein
MNTVPLFLRKTKEKIGSLTVAQTELLSRFDQLHKAYQYITNLISNSNSNFAQEIPYLKLGTYSKNSLTYFSSA